ncbi:oxalate decarboxylase [Fomitiporia mediterranea MF3/22]|uniref:oxalate decarboxylase n=1 Tax=Fomitiporia mediterranea (strain MF3/22) TaxID=694068 RepID=UPI0004407C1D|nr:oxalate decarboxylase [Fomitiporia mediterranea MF3/22]EJD06750.1 oxalate decarboxylase [Fomitiporia mediterranea MF3/22]
MFDMHLLYCLILASTTIAAPAIGGNGSSTVGTAVPVTQIVAPAGNNPNFQPYPQGTDEIPQPINRDLGAPLMAPDNIAISQQNPDLLAPPSTDHGSVENAKWPFALSHNRLHTGGWARQQNVDVLPVATNMASVNMRLAAGAIRELHWHTSAEWAYVLKGTVIVTAVNTDGQNPGDLWFFPAGIPHSIQATDDDPQGSEFVLVFDDGTFSETSTFQVTEWTAHMPKEVLARNFRVDMSAFDHIPSEELFIFPAAVPSKDQADTTGPAGTVPNPYTYKLSQAPEVPLAGGWWKVFDTSVFPAANTIVGALVSVEPGAIRELHWHPTQHEWSFFLSGTARMTLFAGRSDARTFSYQTGDVGYVPPSYGHYIENTGNTTLQFLELFNADRVEDISLAQWLALTPPELVKAHLELDDAMIASLNKTKQIVVAPS